MKQSEVFLAGEGEKWAGRNVGRYNQNNDPVLDAIEKYAIHFKTVLEIGSANGGRLSVLSEVYDCNTWGVDPAGYPATLKGTASDTGLPTSGWFDVIIYGWCLYLCDPEDHLKIAMEGDRLLKDGGYLIVYDFHADYPYKTPYKHKKGLFSYHFDFSKLWLSHPAYSLYGRTIQGETSVTILKKNLQAAFPVEK